MRYKFHTTRNYHINHLSSLGWELTTCNSLVRDDSVVRKVLKRDESFGHLLYDFLATMLPMERIRKVIEIGGGYGFLMKDFFDRNPNLDTCMLDISPFLLGVQRETLKRYGDSVSFREEDFLETDSTIPADYELAILNENLGDFPTLTGLDPDILHTPSGSDDVHVNAVRHYFRKYHFPIPAQHGFSLNIGAIRAVEKLCSVGVPFIYLGEHSCEASVPADLRHVLHVESTGQPERIKLMGHDEYTIKFSHLQQVAHTWGYHTRRGPFADFIPINLTKRLRSVLVSGGRYGDEDEAICQFVEDLYKYEYLILTKQTGAIT